MVEPRVIDSDPWWVRVRETINKPTCIVGTAVVLFVIAISILIFILLEGSAGNSTESTSIIDYSKSLIITDERDLWALNLRTKEKKLLQRTNKGISAFAIFKDNTIFWRENSSPWINSHSKKYRNLTESEEWNPTAAAMDFVTEKLYVLDSYAGKLSVFDVNSTNYGIALTDLKDPVDLALDPYRGLMFIVQKSDSVLKGNMDGTSMKKLISSQTVIAVTVDTQTPKLYWSESEGAIFNTDYNGKNRKLVFLARGFTTSLGVSGNRLFWSSPPNSENERTLWNCWISEENGICSSPQKIEFEDPKAIRVYTGVPPEIYNPCENNNGGCQHLCLLKANDGHSCACYDGYQLTDDFKRCKLIKEYVLYVKRNFIRGRILDVNREAFNEAILPIRLQKHLSLRAKLTVDFDYNYHTNTLVFSDDDSINTVDLRLGNQLSFRIKNGCLKNVAFDWLTNDIYYLNDNCGDNVDPTIVLMRQNLSKTLRKFDATSGNLRSLALNPNTGVYFFSVLHKTEAPKIYKINGSKLSILVPSNYSVNVKGLAIDYAEDRIYWLSQNTSLLHHSNLDGEDIKTLNVSVIFEPRSISVHGRYVYLANFTSIWRFDKVTGRGAVRVVPDDRVAMIAGVKVFSRDLQTIKSGVPCASDNGNCEQFCLREPKRVVTGANAVEVTEEVQKKCLCEDQKVISREDGRSCVYQ